MSIHVICQCGRSFGAKEEHAGKRARCPACGQILTIPGKPLAAYDVFISHSKHDKTTADTICAALEANRIRCWIAPRDIVPGKEWGEGIIDGINQCRVMILVFSSKSNQSKQVSREIERAVAKGLFVVPFRIEDIPMSKTMEYFLSSPHWLDAITPPLKQHLNVVVRTVKSLLSPSVPINPAPSAAPVAPAVAAAGSGVPTKLASWRTIWTAHRRPVAWAAGALATALLVVLLVGSLSSWKPAEQEARLIANGSVGTGKGGASLSAPPLPDNDSRKARDVPGDGSSGNHDQTDRSSAVVQSVSRAARASEPASYQLSLRDGPVVCSFGSLSVRSVSAASRGEEEGGFADRLILVTNQRDMPVSEIKQDVQADLSFQINNQSAETVTLTQIQVLLLGIVPCYEDRIAEPIAPHVAKPIENLTVEENSPPRHEYADLAAVFADDDTPRQELQYKVIENTNPDVVTADITEQRKVNLYFAPSQSGLAEIVVAAVDPFELSAKCIFSVEVKPTTTLKPVEVVNYNSMPPPSSGPISPGSEVSDPFAGSSNKVDVFRVEEKPMFLGSLMFVHALRARDQIAPCTSGNLLPEGKAEVMQPNRAKLFRVRIGCWTSHQVPAPKSSTDKMIGLIDPRRKLTVSEPVLVEVHHLLAICIRINSEDGKSQDVYCDHLYRLGSLFQPIDQGRAKSELQSGAQDHLEDAARAVLVSLLKSHDATSAYGRATLCGSVPDGFDASTLSLFCYYGDPISPFRAASSTSLFSERDRCPRSNVVEVLMVLQRENPPLWHLINDQLVQLASVNNDLAPKARALQQEMQAKRPVGTLVQSLVRVEKSPAEPMERTGSMDPFGPSNP